MAAVGTEEQGRLAMRLLKKLFIMLMVVLAGVAGWLYYCLMTPIAFHPQVQSFDIALGQTSRQIVTMLAQKKVLEHPEEFLMVMRLMGITHRVKAGSYEIHSPLTSYLLMKKITDGDVQSSSLRIIEGWRWSEVKKVVLAESGLQHDIENMSDEEIIKAVGVKEGHLEGVFFPDTYHYAKGSSDLAVLKRAYALMQKNLQVAWDTRVSDLPYSSPYALLIMASLIEKETGRAADREWVAGVFVNRLRLGMRLQTDPTVIYGMGENYKGKLRKVDLLTDNAYNTYTRAGLPPSPIAMPGKAALFAAANPASVSALYFVAKGDGSSHFSSNLLEHNQAVNQYVRRGNR